jgi:hypothetical protein
MKKIIVVMKLRMVFIITLLCLASCGHKKNIDKQQLIINQSAKIFNPRPQPSAPAVTIWVYGTLLFRKPAYYKIFGDTSRLLPVTSLTPDHHFYQLAQTISERNPEKFPLEEFYIFNWSGKLAEQERKKAAQKLYEEIIHLQGIYKEKHGTEPIIQVITHSHGGNVVLNMAHIAPKDIPFYIASLILLACPVQQNTMHTILHPLFDKIYSLYSSIDLLQILAPQICLKKSIRNYKIPSFSSRLFPNSDKIVQVKLKINDYPISHTHFSMRQFVTLLPDIIDKLDSWQPHETYAKDFKKKLLCVYNK